MSKKILLTILALCLLAVSLLFAQEADPSEKILKTSQSKINELKDFSADFSKLHKSSPSAEATEAKGRFKLKGEKFKVEFSDQMLICDGTTQWSYRVDEEVIVSDYDVDEGFSPKQLLKFTQDEFRSKYASKETVSGRSANKIELLPKTKAKEYWKLVLWLDASTYLPLQMTIYNRNGSRVTYKFSNIKTNTGLSDALFSMKEADYPDVEWIDER